MDSAEQEISSGIYLPPHGFAKEFFTATLPLVPTSPSLNLEQQEKTSLISDYLLSKGGKSCIGACWNFECALITEILETVAQAMATSKTAAIEPKVGNQ